MHVTASLLTLPPGLGVARWALAQMGTLPPRLRQVPGLTFAQLMGSGAANGFGSWPNWQRYGLLASWQSAAAAEDFLAGHPLWQAWQHRTAETWTAHLRPLHSHGAWYGRNPFLPATADTPAPPAATPGPLAVLTRASIRLGAVPRFWRYVEPTSRALAHVPGVRLAIGLGELPLVRQATFSIWDSAEAMRRYAYQHPAHREAMQLTRRESWYREELFARFQVLSMSGTVDGVEVLR